MMPKPLQISRKREGEYCYRYPHPALTADCVIFGFDGEELKILLVERGVEPYKGMWALPGGFMRIDETIEQTAKRELREETSLSDVYLEQFRVYSGVGRDPRERVVTVAFIALIRPDDYKVVAGDDASNALWFNERFLPPMAFDHTSIIREAREHLAETLRIKPVAFQLLNPLFSMTELQRVYEAINHTSYDRRNFQRKALQSGLIHEEVTLPSVSADMFDTEVAYHTASPATGLCPDEPAPDIQKKSSPRQRKRFFFFRDRKTNRSDSDYEEGSIKDLFNF